MDASYLTFLRTNDFRCVFRYYYNVNANTGFCIPKLAVDVSYLKHAADDCSRRHFRCIYVAESSNQRKFSFNVSVHSTHYGSNSEQSDLGKDCLYVFKVIHFCLGHISCK